MWKVKQSYYCFADVIKESHHLYSFGALVNTTPELTPYLRGPGEHEIFSKKRKLRGVEVENLIVDKPKLYCSYCYPKAVVK